MSINTLWGLGKRATILHKAEWQALGRPSNICLRSLTFIAIVLLSSLGVAQRWVTATDDSFTVLTAAAEDAEHLQAVFSILQCAKQDLRRGWNLTLPPGVTVVIHPDLTSFSQATRLPWYIAGAADRTNLVLNVQRLRVLLERQSLETTLRHELFHLVQPPDWSRWQSEGAAMLFAGELPSAQPFEGISEAELNRRLATAASREDLARSVATAYLWTQRYGFPAHRQRC